MASWVMLVYPVFKSRVKCFSLLWFAFASEKGESSNVHIHSSSLVSSLPGKDTSTKQLFLIERFGVSLIPFCALVAGGQPLLEIAVHANELTYDKCHRYWQGIFSDAMNSKISAQIKQCSQAWYKFWGDHGSFSLPHPFSCHLDIWGMVDGEHGVKHLYFVSCDPCRNSCSDICKTSERSL